MRRKSSRLNVHSGVEKVPNLTYQRHPGCQVRLVRTRATLVRAESGEIWCHRYLCKAQLAGTTRRLSSADNLCGNQNSFRRFHAPIAFCHLIINPGVGFFHAIAQPRVRLPSQIFLDQRIVAVAAVDTLWRLQIIGALELNTGNVLDDIDQPVDGDNLTAAQIERFEDIAVQDGLRPFEAIINIHETAGLKAITPDLDFMFA